MAVAEGGPWKGIQKLLVVAPELLELPELELPELLELPPEDELLEELLEPPLLEELELLEEDPPEDELLDVEPDEDDELPEEEEPPDDELDDEPLDEELLDDEPLEDEEVGVGWPPDESPPQAAREAVKTSTVMAGQAEARRMRVDKVFEIIILCVSQVTSALCAVREDCAGKAVGAAPLAG